MPQVHPPNHFPPPPYFPIPFPPPPVAPSNVSNAHSAPVSDISAALTLMTNAVMQGNSNTTAITNALERTTMQFANALQQTRFLMVLNHLSVTHGWRRYTRYVFKQGGPSARCCYYVQVKLSATSSRICPRKQRMIKLRMTS